MALYSTTLFNSASLDVLLPSCPSLLSSAPPPTTFANSQDPTATAETDQWVSQLLASPPRTQVFIDEPLHALTVLALPTSTSSSLSRSEAAALLLHSLPSPHLSLTLDLTYPDDPRPPLSTSSHSFDHLQSQPPVRGASISALAAKIPVTPAPLPATLDEERGTEGGAGAGTRGVPVATAVYKDEGGRVWVGKDAEGRWVGVWEIEVVIPFIRSQASIPKLSLVVTVTLRDDPQLEIVLERARKGILPGLGGARVGTGEDVLEEDDEYMDEASYDHVNLLGALTPFSAAPLHLPYSRLPSAYLPPLPPTPSRVLHRSTRSRSHSHSVVDEGATPLHPSLRRSCRRVLPVHSAVQVQMRTVLCPVGALGIAEGGRVWERDNEDGVVLCLEVTGPSSADGSGSEGFEIEGIDVTVDGGSPSAGGTGATREQQDVEVRQVLTAGVDFPLRVYGGGESQYNFLYALATVPSAGGAASGPLAPGAEVDHPSSFNTVPIAVATSPTQRFQARFGAVEVEQAATAASVGEIALRRGAVAPLVAGGVEGGGRTPWVRNVAIVVKGRPFGKRARKEGKREQEGGYEIANGRDVEKKVEEREEEEQEHFSVEPFSSRWNCTLDISSFARRTPPRIPPFGAQTGASHPRPLSFNPRYSHPSSSSHPPLVSRPSSLPPLVEFESVAGSKRHTAASLAALSLKSPVMNRRGSAAFPRPPPLNLSSGMSGTAGTGTNEQRRPSRALPPTPLSPPAVFTPGATGGPPKRFFSLPSANSSATDIPPLPAQPPHPPSHPHSSIISPFRTETPPPMPLSLPQRTSLPPVGEETRPASLGAERAKESKRASWMTFGGGGGGGSATSASNSPTVPLRASSFNVTSGGGGGAGAGAATGWDRRQSTVGLGLEDVAVQSTGSFQQGPPSTSRFQQPQPFQQQQQQYAPPLPPPAGKLLVSVSLVPLRTAKSRRPRPPFAGESNADLSLSIAGDGSEGPPKVGRTNENLPPPSIPGLAPPSPNPSVPPTPQTAFSFPPASPNPSTPSSAVSTPALRGPTPSSPLLQDPPDSFTAARALAERTNLSTSRMPRVNLLDVFLVEIFISNQSERVVRYTVGVPPPKIGVEEQKRRLGFRTAPAGEGGGRGKREEEERRTARLVPLENDVRIGPLAPNTCASVGIRFLAISPGAHCVEALRLVDLGDGTETLLKKPVWVVVE